MLTEDGIKDGCEASQKLRIYIYICVKHQKSEVDFTQKRQKKKKNYKPQTSKANFAIGSVLNLLWYDKPLDYTDRVEL